MSKINRITRPAGSPDGDPQRGTRFRRFVRLKARLQDWIAGPDEQFAAERGWTTTRSASGWSVTVRDPRFDRRHVCDACAGTGRHPITGTECADCTGVGVVTDPERGEQA